MARRPNAVLRSYLSGPQMTSQKKKKKTKMLSCALVTFISGSRGHKMSCLGSFCLGESKLSIDIHISPFY
ncbi:hypothetical protein LDENG_00153190 [Lucifuga dentata]|nr:hypothetical protein LDENG_00153190 [Lucifuga dentata]